jgi:diguanylate cyclase (GGDEF)-like protein/PAS domain S-box-containing protein
MTDSSNETNPFALKAPIEAYQAGESPVQALFDTMNEGFVLLELICDEKGNPHDVRHLLANPAYERQTGQKLTDIIGRTARELHPGIEASWIAKFGKVALTGEPAHFEGHFGSLGRWFDVRAYQTGPGRLALMFFDVTKHREMVDRLRQQAIIFSSTEEGIVITDAQGRVIEANPAFERITEYPMDELRGQKMSLLQSGRHDRMFYQRMWEALIGNGRWQGEIWNRRKGGDIYIEWITISAVRNEDDEVVNYVGTSIDLSRMKHAQSELERLAHHDALTNMPNRLLLVSRIEHAIDRVKRNGGLGAVLFIDLDRFKVVNDTWGHASGDELLKAVARRIRARLRDVDTLARLGGDEFVVLLDGIAGSADAATVAQDLVAQLGQPFVQAEVGALTIGASIGIALFPFDGSSAAMLIEHADRALYAAKNSGRGAYRFFSALTA